MDLSALVTLDYARLRLVEQQLVARMLQDLPRATLMQAARRLGMLGRGDVITTHTDTAREALHDFALHSVDEGGQSAARTWAARHPYADGTDEQRLLSAMAHTEVSIYCVEELIPDLGVRVRDIFHERERLVADMAMAESAVPDLMFLGRLLQVGNYWMTTSLAIQATSRGLGQLDERLRAHPGIDPDSEDPEPPPGWSDTLASIAIPCLLAHPPAGTVAQPPRRVPPKPTRRPAQNLPCPCGSGRKHKNCCGAV